MRFVAFALAALTAVGCGKTTNPDLAYASPDDAAVVHVRVAEMMGSPLGKQLLALIERQGGTADMEKDLGLKLDQIETVTLAVPEGPNGEPGNPRIFFRTKDEIKPDSLFPNNRHESVTVAGFSQAFKIEQNLLLVLDGKRFLFLPDQAKNADSLNFKFVKEGALSPAFEAITGGKSQIVIAVNPKVVPADELRGTAAMAGEFVKDGRVPVLELTAGDDLKANLSVYAKDSDDAEAAGKAMSDTVAQLKALLLLAGGELGKGEGAELVDSVKKMLDGAKVSGSGKSRTLTAALQLDVKVIDGMLGSVKGAAERTRSVNNLKQIGLGFHNYHDVYTSLPWGNIKPGAKAPALSWRVAILPFIEQNALYNQFKLDEPWDSPTNKKLISRMPAIFMIPGSDPAVAKAGKTYYRSFTLGNGMKFTGITDGLSNTAAVVETAEPVEWTKPETLDPNAKDLHALIRWAWGSKVANVLLYDGSVQAMKSSVSNKTLKNVATPNDGEALGSDW